MFQRIPSYGVAAGKFNCIRKFGLYAAEISGRIIDMVLGLGVEILRVDDEDFLIERVLINLNHWALRELSRSREQVKTYLWLVQ